MIRINTKAEISKLIWFSQLIEERQKGWERIFRKRISDKPSFLFAFVFPPFVLTVVFLFFKHATWSWKWLYQLVYSPLQVLLFFALMLSWIFLQARLIEMSAATNKKRVGEQKTFLLSFFSFYPVLVLAPLFVIPFVGKPVFLVACIFYLRLLWQGGAVGLHLEGEILFRWFLNIFVSLFFLLLLFLSFLLTIYYLSGIVLK